MAGTGFEKVEKLLERSVIEIARDLGMSSSKVSRLLKRAFSEGVVRVEIERLARMEYPSALALSVYGQWRRFAMRKQTARSGRE